MPHIQCPYCHKPADLVSGDKLYLNRPDLHSKRFWRCAPCDAYVGCHPGTQTPMGTLANYATREARKQAHRVFDIIWKSGKMSRTSAYVWLSAQLGIEPCHCHIAMMDATQCSEVVRLASKLVISTRGLTQS